MGAPESGAVRRQPGRLGVPPPVFALLLLLSGFVVAYEVRVTAVPSWRGPTFDGLGPDIAFAMAGGLLVVRGRREWPWALIGLGAICWASGDIYWTQKLAKLTSPPVPSWADVGYLSFYPLALLGILGLIRRRTRRPTRWLAVDALAAALAAAGLSAAIVVQPILAHAKGGTAALATNLAYPLVDLALLGMLVGAVALSGWRLDRTWLVLALGVAAFWVADSLYLIADAKGTYHVGDWYNPLWYFAPVLFAWAAWLADRTPLDSRAGPPEGLRAIAMPLLFALCAVGTLAWTNPSTDDAPAVALSTASLLVVLARLAITWQDHTNLLRRTQTEALTDPLTGLGNRRALLRELERRTAGPGPERPYMLALFDLDGFKQYNDRFGHLAGDALLSRLARKLEAQLKGRGTAYRMGGDEFCVLIDPPNASEASVKAAASALSERGDGFDILCSFGSVALPTEARSTTQALRVADHRMYAQKRGGRVLSLSQSKEAIARVVGQGELSEGGASIADVAAAVALASGAVQDEAEEIRQAAALHDIGKVAIPAAILEKPGQLTDIEWAFVRSHTIVGERILDAAPELQPLARLVRSSHERFDGNGYPDGLAGQRIPLGSRILAVCDAFAAMTTDRPYRTAVSVNAALAELRRAAGTQFDPNVVEAFCQAITLRPSGVQREALV